jgi:hypothetical protein
MGAQHRSRCNVPRVGVSNRATAKFCIECAAALVAAPMAARSSGAAQPARPEKDTVALGAPLEPHDVLDGERKTVTALFADIKGSTELMRDLDPEEAGTPSTQTSPIRDRSQTPSELGSWQD